MAKKNYSDKCRIGYIKFGQLQNVYSVRCRMLYSDTFRRSSILVLLVEVVFTFQHIMSWSNSSFFAKPSILLFHHDLSQKLTNSLTIETSLLQCDKKWYHSHASHYSSMLLYFCTHPPLFHKVLQLQSSHKMYKKQTLLIDLKGLVFTCANSEK